MGGQVQRRAGRQIRGLMAAGVATTLALGGLVAGGHGAALAATVSAQVALPVSSFGDMVVDPLHNHVLVSSPGSNEILVLDFAGNTVGTLTGLAGPDAMVLDGSTLYVTLSTAGAIDRIDTGTLAETGMLTQGALVKPTQLVEANGALWTGTQSPDVNNVCLSRVDMGTGQVTTFAAPYCYYGLGIRPNPANTDMLVTWDLGLEPATITTLDISTGSPVQLQSRWEQVEGNLQDIAGGPSGNGFITASGSPYEFDEWNYSDLQQNGIVYPASNYPTAVTTTGANGGLMAGGLDATYGNAIWVYRYDNPGQLLFEGAYGAEIAPRGLEFSPDGQSVFGVSVSWNGSTYTVSFLVVSLGAAPMSGKGATVSATEGQSFSSLVGSFSGGTPPYRASINWGDGTVSTGSVAASGNADSVTGQHAYAEEGTAQIAVTVTDASGASLGMTGTATIGDASVSAVVNSARQSSKNGRYLIATLTDTDAGGVASDYTATVTLAAKKSTYSFSCPSTTCTISANGSGGFAISVSSSALPSGTYTATVSVRDAGGATATATGSVSLR